MARKQSYGIKYPFSSDNNESVYIDLNESYDASIRSQVFHVIFTPKGQKLRDPEFGTDMIKYIFEPNNGDALSELKAEITKQISTYVPNVIFKDFDIYTDSENEHTAIVSITYEVTVGNRHTEYTDAIKL